MIDRDMIDHLEANGFRVVPRDRIRLLTVQKSEDLRTFNFIQADDVAKVMRSTMAMQLGGELLQQVGYTAEDHQGRRVFKLEVEVIL